MNFKSLFRRYKFVGGYFLAQIKMLVFIATDLVTTSVLLLLAKMRPLLLGSIFGSDYLS